MRHTEMHSAILGGVRRARSQLQNTNERLQELEQSVTEWYHGSPVMMLSVDSENARILQCNETLAIKLGYNNTSEIVGKDLAFVYHESFAGVALEELYPKFQETGRLDNEFVILRKADGTPLRAVLNVAAIRNTLGQIVRSNSVYSIVEGFMERACALCEFKREAEKGSGPAPEPA